MHRVFTPAGRPSPPPVSALWGLELGDSAHPPTHSHWHGWGGGALRYSVGGEEMHLLSDDCNRCVEKISTEKRWMCHPLITHTHSHTQICPIVLFLSHPTEQADQGNIWGTICALAGLASCLVCARASANRAAPQAVALNRLTSIEPRATQSPRRGFGTVRYVATAAVWNGGQEPLCSRRGSQTSGKLPALSQTSESSLFRPCSGPVLDQIRPDHSLAWARCSCCWV